MSTDTKSPNYREVKVFVPFPSAANPQIRIAGILAQHDPLDPLTIGAKANPRPLALITHGVLAHKNQCYHPLLAQSLPIDSFRFDFRGNDETPELPGQEWDMASYGKDIEDMDAVLAHLASEYGYRCDLIIGHSRGSLVGWKWFAEHYGQSGKLKEGLDSSSLSSSLPASPPLWVSLGGRWRMERIHDRDSIYNPAFAERGYYEWNVTVNRKPKSVRIYPESVRAFAEYPIHSYAADFPAASPCLLLHGTSDETVPCADVGYYLNLLNGRADRVQAAATNTALTQVHLVEGGNHMFRGKYQEVVDIITNWYRSQRPSVGTAVYQDGDSNTAATAASTSGTESGDQLALEAKQEGDVLEKSWQRSTVKTDGSPSKL